MSSDLLFLLDLTILYVYDLPFLTSLSVYDFLFLLDLTSFSVSGLLFKFCAVSLRLDIFCLHITSAQITCL